MASDSDSHHDSDSHSNLDSTESLSQSRCNVEDANRLVECTRSNGKPCQACERRSKLHNQIEATKKLLEKLLLEDNEALMDINRCHDPLHRLPPEITAHIFCLTVTTDFVPQPIDKYTDDLKFQSEVGALTLGAVCRRWRIIAWSTPQLWSTVTLSVRCELTEPTWIKIEVVKEWLERSRSLPLTIRLDMDDYYENADDNPSLALNFVHMFNGHSDRWETLSVQAPDWLFKFFTSNRNGAPLLKTLHLVLKDYLSGSDGIQFEVRGTMPQPKHVVTVGYRQLKNVGISWSNVTNAVLDLLRLEDCVQLLLLAPMLVNLRFQRIIQQRSTLPAVKKPILVMQHLRTLTLEFTLNFNAHYTNHFSVTHPTPYSAILDSVTVPLLEDLRLEGPGRGSRPFNSLKKLLDRSSCPLINLRLDAFQCEQQAVLDLLYILPPSIKNFQLDVRQPSRSHHDHDLYPLFSHLACNPAQQHGMPSGSVLLPNLEEFKYHVFKETEIPWELLPNLLNPLSGLPRPFKNLSIIERHRSQNSPQLFAKGKQVDKDIIQALMKLKDGGVDLFLPSEVSYEDLLKLLEE